MMLLQWPFSRMLNKLGLLCIFLRRAMMHDCCCFSLVYLSLPYVGMYFVSQVGLVLACNQSFDVDVFRFSSSDRFIAG